MMPHYTLLIASEAQNSDQELEGVQLRTHGLAVLFVVI